jgi:hypothetical protein
MMHNMTAYGNIYGPLSKIIFYHKLLITNGWAKKLQKNCIFLYTYAETYGRILV